jgi:hypothetical protein
MSKNVGEKIKRQSNAIHHILTDTNNEKSKLYHYFPPAWFFYHQLMVLLSLRDRVPEDEWKEITADMLVKLTLPYFEDSSQIAQPACWYELFPKDKMVDLGYLFKDLNLSNSSPEINRMFEFFKNMRNENLKKVDHPFGYLLMKGDVEVDSLYIESDLHYAMHYDSYDVHSLFRGSTEYIAQTFHFEVKGGISRELIEKKLTEYFAFKNMTFTPNLDSGASVIDSGDNIILKLGYNVYQGTTNSVVRIYIAKLL